MTQQTQGKEGEGMLPKLTGPPMAPRKTASAFFAALRASSVRGSPVASMEAYVNKSNGGRAASATDLQKRSRSR
jgi:hypothetical protein